MPSPSDAVAVPDVSSTQDMSNESYDDYCGADVCHDVSSNYNDSCIDGCNSSQKLCVNNCNSGLESANEVSEYLTDVELARSKMSEHVKSNEYSIIDKYSNRELLLPNQELEINCRFSQYESRDCKTHYEENTNEDCQAIIVQRATPLQLADGQKCTFQTEKPAKFEIEVKNDVDSIKQEQILENNMINVHLDARDSVNCSSIKVECKNEVKNVWKLENDEKLMKMEVSAKEKHDTDIMPPPKAPAIPLNKSQNYDAKFSRTSPFMHMGRDSGRNLSNHIMNGYSAYFGSKFSAATHHAMLMKASRRFGNWSSSGYASTSARNTAIHLRNLYNSRHAYKTCALQSNSAPSSSAPACPEPSGYVSGSSIEEATSHETEDGEELMTVEKFYLQQRFSNAQRASQANKRRDDSVVTSSVSDLGEYHSTG